MIVEISIAVLAICAVVLTIEKIVHNKILRESAMFQFHSTINLTGDTLDILEDFINKIFDEHIMLKGDYSNVPYINSTEETNLRQEITNKVSSRISSTMYYQLSLYYNKDSIPDIIGEKIYELVSIYVVQHNSMKPPAKK